MTQQDITLEQIFGSEEKIQLIKFFAYNPTQTSSLRNIKKSVNIKNGRDFKRAIEEFKKIGLLKSSKKGGKEYFSLNKNFILFEEINNILFKTSPISKEKLREKLRKLKSIKLFLITGSLLNIPKEDGEPDVFMVGKNPAIKKIIQGLEKEMGKELQYTIMDLKEFRYRYKMFDRFVRDILEQPHIKLVDKLQIKKSKSK